MVTGQAFQERSVALPEQDSARDNEPVTLWSLLSSGSPDPHSPVVGTVCFGLKTSRCSGGGSEEESMSRRSLPCHGKTETDEASERNGMMTDSPQSPINSLVGT